MERSKKAVRGPQTVLLESVSETDTLRLRRVVRAHVEVLRELAGDWPPILVWGDENRIVDGHHRVAAARALGMPSIEAEWFDGTAHEAYLEGIRRNGRYGLPLSLRDRVRAAHRVLEQQPRWSDRRIAALCGLSSSTVARVRQESGFGADQTEERPSRLGMDGRLRPSLPGDARRRVLSALQEHPDGSLRSIAAIAEVSPETVRNVRRRLRDNPQDPDPTDNRLTSKAPADRCENAGLATVIGPVTIEQMPGVAPRSWEVDTALSSCDSAERLVDWLLSGSHVYEWPEFVMHVPLGRIYEIADEARRRSQAWINFANVVEARANVRSCVAS